MCSLSRNLETVYKLNDGEDTASNRDGGNNGENGIRRSGSDDTLNSENELKEMVRSKIEKWKCSKIVSNGENKNGDFRIITGRIITIK